MRGLDWFGVVHPDDRASMVEGTGAFFSGEINDYRGVFRMFKPDGRMIWVYLLVAAIDQSEPRDRARYYLIIEDITKTYESEVALQTALEKYKDVSAQFEEQFYFLRSLFDATEDWIFPRTRTSVTAPATARLPTRSDCPNRRSSGGRRRRWRSACRAAF